MSISTKPQTFAEITNDQVEAWKKKHGKVFLIEVPTSDDPNSEEKARFFAKSPSVSQMNAITEIGADKKRGGAVPALQTLIAIVILGGDMKYLESECEDPGVYLAVQEELESIVGKKKATLTKV